MKTLTPEVANEIKDELENIPEKYQKDFNSTHEGLAVIQEDTESIHRKRMRKEAIQLAAMCVQFIQELT